MLCAMYPACGGSSKRRSGPTGSLEAPSIERSASVAAVTAAATTVATTTTTAATALAVLRLVHLQGTAVEVGAVQRLGGAGRIRIRHFHEAEAAGTIRLAIGDQRDLLDGSMLRKQGTHGLIGRGERKVANV